MPSYIARPTYCCEKAESTLYHRYGKLRTTVHTKAEWIDSVGTCTSTTTITREDLTKCPSKIARRYFDAVIGYDHTYVIKRYVCPTCPLPSSYYKRKSDAIAFLVTRALTQQ